MSAFAAQFNAALQKAMSRSEAASKAGKASAAARKARAGGGSGQTTDPAAARAKADALIAANPGKYGPKGAKGKAKGKGAKPKAAKDPAAAKAKAEKEQQAAQEHAQSRAEHEQDRAQHQSDRAERQKEHAQAQSEHAADRAAKAQAQAKREKQQSQKQKQQAKDKAAKTKEKAAPKDSTDPKARDAAAKQDRAQGDLLASVADNPKNLGFRQAGDLERAGLVARAPGGGYTLTDKGNAKVAARQQEIDSGTQKLAKAFVPVSAWHGWASITKVDEEQRIVYGDASTETPDAQPGIWKGEAYAGDIIAMDAIAAALPDFMQWANLREMHQPSAAGVVIDASVEGSRFPIAAHVTDDQAWRKVTSGTYKGFSIGGQCQDAEIIKIEGRPFRRITKLSLTEISLVDRPANPQARITLYKGDVMADQEVDATDETVIAKAADPAKVIAMLQELRNAAETNGDLDAADTYTQTIRSVAQASGIAPTDDEPAMDDADMADDSALAMDDTGAADDVMMAIKAGDLRKAFPNHSDDDLIDLLLKRGAAISGTTMGHLKGAHDSLQKATGGAVCAQPGQPAAIAQAAMLAPDDLAKALAPPFEGIRKLLEQNGLEVKGLLKRLDTLERQPAPGAPNARVVPMEKSLPGGDAPAADTGEAELSALRKVRDSATDDITRRAVADEITKRELRAVYRGAGA